MASEIIRRPGGLTTGLMLLSLLVVAGCASPVSAPGNEAVAPTAEAVAPVETGAAAPVDVAATMTAVRSAARAEGQLPAGQVVDEALVSLEERQQALEMRLGNLATQTEAPTRSAEIAAAVADLEAMGQQWQLAVGQLHSADEAGRAARVERLRALLDGITSLAKRVRALPEVAGTDVDARLANLEAPLTAQGAQLGEIATPVPNTPETAPTSAPGATGTP